jgi:hypothetical protein
LQSDEFGPRLDVLRSTGEQKLGWMALYDSSSPSLSILFFNALPCRGFGRYMADSPMVIMWPSRDDTDAEADDSYTSVTLSQRKAPYETMPTPDPDPPFNATLELSETSVRSPFEAF